MASVEGVCATPPSWTAGVNSAAAGQAAARAPEGGDSRCWGCWRAAGVASRAAASAPAPWGGLGAATAALSAAVLARATALLGATGLGCCCCCSAAAAAPAPRFAAAGGAGDVSTLHCPQFAGRIAGVSGRAQGLRFIHSRDSMEDAGSAASFGALTNHNSSTRHVAQHSIAEN